MKLHFLQRYTYLFCLLIALAALGSVKAATGQNSDGDNTGQQNQETDNNNANEKRSASLLDSSQNNDSNSKPNGLQAIDNSNGSGNEYDIIQPNTGQAPNNKSDGAGGAPDVAGDENENTLNIEHGGPKQKINNLNNYNMQRLRMQRLRMQRLRRINNNQNNQQRGEQFLIDYNKDMQLLREQESKLHSVSQQIILHVHDKKEQNEIEKKLDAIEKEVGNIVPNNRQQVLLKQLPGATYVSSKCAKIKRQIAWLRIILPLQSEPALNRPDALALIGNLCVKQNKKGKDDKDKINKENDDQDAIDKENKNKEYSIGNTYLKMVFKPNVKMKREKILFKLLFAPKNKHEVKLSWDNLANSDARAWGALIFKIAKHYFNEKPNDYKGRPCYAFFRPYASKLKIAKQYKDQLQTIATRINNDEAYKAFLKALVGQHTYFMHAFISEGWEKSRIKRYLPSSLWYKLAMLFAKGYSLYIASANYQGLYLLLGRKTNGYTQVVEAQRKILNDILYPVTGGHGIFDTIRVVLMVIMIIRIFSLVKKIKEKGDNYTLPAGIDPSKTRSRFVDLRGLCIYTFRKVPYLLRYACGDYEGNINDIGDSIVILVFIFVSRVFLPKAPQNEAIIQH